MSGNKQTFAFFDLDHTLIPYDTQLLFCNYVIRRKPLRLFYLFFFLPALPLGAVKLLRSKGLKRLFLSFLWRMPRKEIESLAREFVKTEVLPAIYPDLRAEIELHRKAGRITVLNSASPDIYVRFIGEALGFDHYYGTRVEYGERFPLLPGFPSQNNKGSVKLSGMRNILPDEIKASIPDDPAISYRSQGKIWANKPIASSYAYTDSPADLPLLSLADNVVLVHPDSSRLLEMAQKNNWRILRPARPHHGSVNNFLVAIQQALGLYKEAGRK